MLMRPMDVQGAKLIVAARVETLRAGRRGGKRTPRAN